MTDNTDTKDTKNTKDDVTVLLETLMRALDADKKANKDRKERDRVEALIAEGLDQIEAKVKEIRSNLRVTTDTPVMPEKLPMPVPTVKVTILGYRYRDDSYRDLDKCNPLAEVEIPASVLPLSYGMEIRAGGQKYRVVYPAYDVDSGKFYAFTDGWT